MQFRRIFALAVLLAGTASGGVWAEERHTSVSAPAMIALIIDDLGDRLGDGLDAVALPGEITYAILPQTTFSRRLAEAAHAAGKEVMLHQPMQPVSGKAMGPGGMAMDMTRQDLLDTLKANLDSVPHVRGVNNHMGSLLTRHPGHMDWLMGALQQYGGLYFIDSVTTSHTVAQKISRENNLPGMRRHIFLDHRRDQKTIQRQFVRLIQQARKRGYALAIGHPYPETLAVLKRVLPYIEEFGVRLVPVSQLIAHKEQQEERLWQASLSPSHRGVKNSKR
ncbi:MAG: divergent polysaccharide deacetylase family protein [Pseudomonadota bacterium]